MTAVSEGRAYLGPDRRRTVRPVAAERRLAAAPAVRTGGGTLLLVLAVTLVSALVLPRAAAVFVQSATLENLRAGVASLTTALFVTAAISYLLRWRLTGEAPVALEGVALLVYGTVIGFFLPLASAIVGNGASVLGATGLVRALTAVVVMELLVTSLSTPVIDSRLRPTRRFAVAALGLTATFLVLGLASRLSLTPASLGGHVVPLYVSLAAGWAVVAALFVRRGARRMQGDILWLGLALSCLSVGNLLRATPLGNDTPGALSTATVSALAAAVALYGSLRHLTDLLGSLSTERLRLRIALIGHEHQQSDREERMHDVRSTLAAIRCAAGTLHRYDEKLGSSQRAGLQSAVSSELVRLGRLIDPCGQDAAGPFDLGSALAGVIETERAQGSQIDIELRGLVAFGRPEDTAEILQNLLVNARLHAPQTPITIRGDIASDHVEVRVQDAGGGIAPTDRERVFARGRRGSSSSHVPGSGLGLHVSRRLAREQGGDLLIVEGDHDHGACFLLRLPSAAPQEGIDQGDQVVEAGKRDEVRASVG